MKRLFIIFILLACSNTLISQTLFNNYHKRNEFSMASPGAMKFGLYGYDNPALLNYINHPDILFTWSDEFGSFSDFNKWGLFFGIPNMGFSMANHYNNGSRIIDFNTSVGFGSKALSLGIGYNWLGGDTHLIDRNNLITLGTLIRPGKHISLGLVGTTGISGNDYEGVVDLAVRPLGNEKFAIFGDYALRNNMKAIDGYWSAGVAIEALPGIRLTGRYFNNNFITIGMEFSMGRIGISSQGGFNRDLNHRHNTYGIRLGSYDRNIGDNTLRKSKYYASIDLSKPMRYQGYKLFDNSNTLIGTLDAIEAAAEDPRIKGIVINTAGMNINHVFLWELRKQIEQFKETGKKIVVFAESANMNSYHFVSVADKIILDPQGSVNLPGYLMGNIYLNDMLHNIGIGVNEWRLYEYKSGFESLSRSNMSDEDREQRQKIVDNRYNIVKDDIMASRGFSNEKYEELINSIVYFTADQAVEHGLADMTGRWNEVNKLIEEIEGSKKTIIGKDSLQRYQLPDDNYWGNKPQLAIIYAVGVCDLERGIKARSLASDIAKARNNPLIKAIVFRVESPGGSPLASDIVAEALKKAKDEKPVIISQGSVAASGGYWLSMYGDTIVSSPITITGSIGVIAGWFFDDGIKEKIGYGTDFVKKGEFADIGFGLNIPLINMPILDRTFDENEESIIENMLFNTYDEFVHKVAEARGKDYEYIEALSRGRVWTGYDAYGLGLVDTLGGLKTAINIALDKSGIGVDGDYGIIEYPEPGLLDMSGVIQRSTGVENITTKEDPYIKHLRFRLKHNTKPLLLLPSEYTHYYINDGYIFYD